MHRWADTLLSSTLIQDWQTGIVHLVDFIQEHAVRTIMRPQHTQTPLMSSNVKCGTPTYSPFTAVTHKASNEWPGQSKAQRALVAPQWVYGLWCISIYASIQIPVSILCLQIRGRDESKKRREKSCTVGKDRFTWYMSCHSKDKRGKAQKIIDCHQDCWTFVTNNIRWDNPLLIPQGGNVGIQADCWGYANNTFLFYRKGSKCQSVKLFFHSM